MMDDKTLELGLRARPPSDPVYASRVSATPRTDLPVVTWPRRSGPLLTTTSFVLAAVAVALFGSLLLAGILTQPAEESSTEVGAPTPVATVPASLPLDDLPDDTAAVVRLDDGGILLLDTSDHRDALFAPSTGRVAEFESWHPSHGWGITTAKLKDGRVLVLGGLAGSDRSADAELFDPATATFTPVGPMNLARGIALVVKVFGPSAVTLDDGRVLILGGTTEQMEGGRESSGGDLFDPTSATFVATPTIPCPLRPGPDTPARHQVGQEIRWASLLPDGRVLIACEEWPDWPGRQAFLAFDVDAGTFEPIEIDARAAHRVLRLPDGSLLLWEWQATDRLANSERHDQYTLARYDPVAGTVTHFETAVPAQSAVTLLEDGRVLIAGGFRSGRTRPTAAVSVVDPCTGNMTPFGRLASARWGAKAVEVAPGRVLILGGDGGDGVMVTPVPPELVTTPAEPRTSCGARGRR